MEDTLRDREKPLLERLKGLNPCFNGRYSQSFVEGERNVVFISVLILVLMEDTLRERKVLSRVW